MIATLKGPSNFLHLAFESGEVFSKTMSKFSKKCICTNLEKWRFKKLLKYAKKSTEGGIFLSKYSADPILPVVAPLFLNRKRCRVTAHLKDFLNSFLWVFDFFKSIDP